MYVFNFQIRPWDVLSMGHIVHGAHRSYINGPNSAVIEKFETVDIWHRTRINGLVF
jgi:hypothetical protein